MTLSNAKVENLLVNFTALFVEQYQAKHGNLPRIENDPDWLSPCFQENANDNEIYWKPVPVGNELTFSNVEKAMGFELHEDFKAYFSSFYSESIDAISEDGELSLLFAWNKDDFDRLQQNLIGHIMMKQRLKQNITLFFAVTDEDDMIISLDNSTGEIWVEQVGCQPHKKLANSLVEFVEQLSIKI